MCSSDVFLGLLAILFPPLPVWIKCGICSADSVINILLCVLGYIPGLLHAWYIIAKFPENSWDGLPQDHEDGRITYVYVQSPDNSRRSQPRPHGGMNYGTQNAPRPQSQQPRQEQGVATAAGSSNGAHAVPPSYAEVVAGDHKVQTDD